MLAVGNQQIERNKMKKLAAAAIAICMASASYTHAQGKDGIGVGAIVGEPTGVSLKNWVDANRAIDAGVAWSFSENPSLHLHGDYLYHRFDVLSAPELKGRLPLYFGFGARMKFKEGNDGQGRNDHDALLGVRVPLGISYLFSDVPIDIFLEIVPVLDLVPDTDFSFNAAIGARFYLSNRR